MSLKARQPGANGSVLSCAAQRLRASIFTTGVCRQTLPRLNCNELWLVSLSVLGSGDMAVCLHGRFS